MLGPAREALPTPVISAGPFTYKAVNVADQAADPDSLLGWMKRLITLRRQCPEWGWGSCHVVDLGDSGLLAHRAEWKGRRLLAVHNLTDEAAAARLNGELGTRLVPLLSSRIEPDRSDQPKLELEPYGYRWYRLDPSNRQQQST